MNKLEKLRFYDDIKDMFMKEFTQELKEKYLEYSISHNLDSFVFRDWFSEQQKFYKLDNNIYVTANSEENLNELLKELRTCLKKTCKTELDYDNSEQIKNAIRYELNELE